MKDASSLTIDELLFDRLSVYEEVRSGQTY